MKMLYLTDYSIIFQYKTVIWEKCFYISNSKNILRLRRIQIIYLKGNRLFITKNSIQKERSSYILV